MNFQKMKFLLVFTVFWDDLDGAGTLCPPHSSYVHSNASHNQGDSSHLISRHSHSAVETKGRSLHSHQQISQLYLFFIFIFVVTLVIVATLKFHKRNINRLFQNAFNLLFTTKLNSCTKTKTKRRNNCKGFTNQWSFITVQFFILVQNKMILIHSNSQFILKCREKYLLLYLT